MRTHRRRGSGWLLGLLTTLAVGSAGGVGAVVTGDTVAGLTLTVGPSVLTVPTGGEGRASVQLLAPQGNTSRVAPVVRNLPRGVTATFAPPVLSAGGPTTGTLTIAAPRGTAEGTYTFDVEAVDVPSVRLELRVRALPLSTVDVDPTLVPARQALRSMTAASGAERPTARVVDSHGRASEFVTNEVLVISPDRPTADAFAARWGGQVESLYDLQPLGVTDGRAVYLVQIDPMRADLHRFAQDLAAGMPEVRSELRLSSEAGLRTLAVAAQAASEGESVGINWLASGQGFIDRTLTEAPSGPGASYSSNPFDWPHLQAGGATHIGVTEAWRSLALAGRLGNTILVGVMDGGFNWAGNADMPSDGFAGSVVPFGDPAEVENDMGCGGNLCPWHGTSVAQTLTGVVDNAFGTAGVAGPVGRLMTIRTLGDHFTMIGGLVMAGAANVRVLNMSLQVAVPAILSPSVVPFDVATAVARGSGMLLFAAAGNDGADVDAEDCFIFCWESTWHTPCENDGVECIGGITANRARHANSNFGALQVLTYAPFTVFGGPNPAQTGNAAFTFNGTSAASPYAAGVAALIWAADPTLTADEVLALLRSTADPFTVTGGDTRIVNAQAAIAMALVNVPPLVQIVDPTHNEHILYGHEMTFTAQVDDVEDGPAGVTVHWSSQKWGALGTGTTITEVLPQGTDKITAKATDTDGATSTMTITIHGDNVAPVPVITAPAGGATLVQNLPYTLQGFAGDANLPFGLSLPCSSLTWSSPTYPTWSATGCAVQRTFPLVGPTTLVLEATDPYNAHGTVSRTVTVAAPALNGPPNVAISTPHAGDALDHNVATFLNGSAIDPDGGPIVSYRWTIIRNGIETEIRPPAASPAFTWTPAWPAVPFKCGGYSILLRLYATDSQGQTGSSTITIYVLMPVC